MQGDYWTIHKLDRIESHISRFAAEMRAEGHRTVYVDAFAGTGTVTFKARPKRRGFISIHLDATTPGSVRRALRIPTKFGRYLLNDIKSRKAARLSRLCNSGPNLSKRATVSCQDANEFVSDVCNGGQYDWDDLHRAVFVIDPFGMQFHWETLKTIAATKAADVWYLFPISAVNRMLPEDGIVEDSHYRKLENVLGIDPSEFYRTHVRSELFRTTTVTRRNITIDELQRRIVERFRLLFPGAPWPKVVTNRTGSRQFLLFWGTCIPAEQEATRGAARHALELMAYPFDRPLTKELQPLTTDC